MNLAKSQIATCVFDNKIYTFGGLHNDTATNDAEVYDISTNQWTNLASLPIDISNSVCENIDNKFITIFGGVDENNNSINTIIKYYPDTNTYEEMNSSILLPYLPLEGDYIVDNSDTNETYYVGGYLHNSPVRGTSTIENINKEEFLDYITNDNTTTTSLNTSSSSSSGSLPAFNLITLLIMLGGSLFIIRKKS